MHWPVASTAHGEVIDYVDVGKRHPILEKDIASR